MRCVHGDLSFTTRTGKVSCDEDGTPSAWGVWRDCVNWWGIAGMAGCKAFPPVGLASKDLCRCVECWARRAFVGTPGGVAVVPACPTRVRSVS